jgi:hypothetical protein
MSYCCYGLFVKPLCRLFRVVLLVLAVTGGRVASSDTNADADAIHSTSYQGNAKPCGVYLAMSTLPGTGIGMFAGRDYEPEEFLLELGDHTIPIVDLTLHQPDLSESDEPPPFWLWDEYTWDAEVAHASHEGSQSVDVASPGFGAAANSFLDFVNVNEGPSIWSVPHDLHRSKDPGVGGFCMAHSRRATAAVQISAGQELFVSYGTNWYVYVVYVTCCGGWVGVAASSSHQLSRSSRQHSMPGDAPKLVPLESLTSFSSCGQVPGPT